MFRSPARLSTRLLAALLLCTHVAWALGREQPAAPATDVASLRAFASAERARPPAPRFSRAEFLARPMLREARLSPDGRAVAALVENGRDRSLWLADAGTPGGRSLLARTSAEELEWSHDGRWLFLSSPNQLYALAMAGQAGSGAIAKVGDQSRREFVGVDPWHPAAVLVRERPPQNSPLPKRWRLWRSEIGGRTTLLHEGALQIVDFALAPNGALSHLALAVGDAHVVVRREARGGWRALTRCAGWRRCDFLGTRNGGRDLLIRSSLESDLLSLAELGADGALRILHVDPRAELDLERVVLDPLDNAPLIAGYGRATSGNHGLTASTRATLATIRKQFPHAVLRIEVGRGERAHWLLRERGGALRGERLHLFDPRSGQRQEVFAQLAFQHQGKPVRRFAESAMARQLPLSWTASDGMRLHGFLWLPPGIDAGKAPLVVNVHGGPFNHVRPEFNSRAQFLANRGYVVFAPNFRASTGHGRRYVLSSQGDFGGDGRVQRDIVEGTRWLLANGIGDPARVGIVGGSFGGYATLLGLSFQPELFKVGVAAVPPSDFGFVIREYLRSGVELVAGVPMAASMRHVGLDPADRVLMGRLHAGSPVANVARMRRPVLLLAGGEDERVPIRGVLDYAARLQSLGKDVSLFVDAEAGHGVDDPRTREAYYYLEELLLSRQLGGVAPEPPSALLREHLMRNLRLTGASLAGAATPAPKVAATSAK